MRAAGITVYTIGLGQDADPTLLQDIAVDPTRPYDAPSASDLQANFTARLTRTQVVCP